MNTQKYPQSATLPNNKNYSFKSNVSSPVSAPMNKESFTNFPYYTNIHTSQSSNEGKSSDLNMSPYMYSNTELSISTPTYYNTINNSSLSSYQNINETKPIDNNFYKSQNYSNTEVNNYSFNEPQTIENESLGNISYEKRGKSKSLHNLDLSNEDSNSYDYRADNSLTDINSIHQKENYEPSIASTANSERSRISHSKSFTRSLKHAISGKKTKTRSKSSSFHKSNPLSPTTHAEKSSNSRRSSHEMNRSINDVNRSSSSHDMNNKGAIMKDNASINSSGNRRQSNFDNTSINEGSINKGYSNYSTLHRQTVDENALVFKPSSGAISNYSDLLSSSPSFDDFDELITSDKTKKISLTPVRMNEISRTNTTMGRLKPKLSERENVVPIRVMNHEKEKMNFDSKIDEDYDSDDSIDRLLNDSKPKRKQETLYEFLKNSGPEDFMGNNNNKSKINKYKLNENKENKANNNLRKSATKYIPIKIQYSPFKSDNVNENSSNKNVNSPLNSTPSNSLPMKLKPSIKPIIKSTPNQAINSTNNVPIQTKPLAKSTISSPVQNSYNVAKNSPTTISSPTQTAIKSVSTTAMNNVEIIPAQAAEYKVRSSSQMYKVVPVQQKPRMVSTGTQYYISDAVNIRKKRVLFRPVDKKNPIAKYMFNHSFVDSIIIQSSYKKRYTCVKEKIPEDFLARYFYYYRRNPSLVPKIEIPWDYPERDTNPIAKYMFGQPQIYKWEYPERDTNPIAKYMFGKYINVKIEEEDSEWEYPERDTNPIAKYMFGQPQIYKWEYPERDTNPIAKYMYKSFMAKETKQSLVHVEDSNELNDITEVNSSDIEDETTMIKDSGIIDQEEDLEAMNAKEREMIVNKLFQKIIVYIEEKDKKEKEADTLVNDKSKEFAKLMFEENTKLHKELSKIRSELSAERVLRERAEEELVRYENLMHSTLNFLN